MGSYFRAKVHSHVPGWHNDQMMKSTTPHAEHSNVTKETKDRDYLYIESDSALTDLCAQLQDSPWLAVDTEFERTSTYYPELCLVQVADSGQVVLVDPLAIGDLTPLFEVFYNPSITKVFHAARQDLEILYHIRGSIPQPVFDTQIAAGMLGYDSQTGYANLVKALLGVELPKSQTRTDWKRRPLSHRQLEYAADDVIYLGELYTNLQTRLIEDDKLQQFRKECLALDDPQIYEPDPGTVWKKIKAAKKLQGSVLNRLKKLASWREITARAENQPRKWILKDQALLDMAQKFPGSRDELSRIPGLHKRVIQMYGETLLKILQG